MENLKRSKLKHGMSVTCTLEGEEITDAKISINKGEDIDFYLCQNKVITPINADDKLGYEYSYIVGQAGEWREVENLKEKK